MQGDVDEHLVAKNCIFCKRRLKQIKIYAFQNTTMMQLSTTNENKD